MVEVEEEAMFLKQHLLHAAEEAIPDIRLAGPDAIEPLFVNAAIECQTRAFDVVLFNEL